MTTQPDRIQLDGLTSDALDQLYARLDALENGARERSALLEEARDALENAGAHGAHGNDWPRLAPAIEELAADRAGWKARFERVQDRVAELEIEAVTHRARITELETASAPEVDRRPLHARHVTALTTAYPDLRHTADHIANLILGVRDEHVRALEQRASKATRAVDLLAEQYRALEQRVAELTAGQCTHQPTP